MLPSRFSRRAALTFGLGAALAPTRAWAQPAPAARALDRASRCLLLGWRGPVVPSALLNLIARDALGGVIVSRENLATPDDLTRVTSLLQARVPRGAPPLLIAADQEGGPVAHLSPPLPSMPSLTTLGAIDDPALTARCASALAASLRDAGVNLDLAPVLDVRTNRQNMVVYGRVFGSQAALVAAHGLRFVRALQAAGVIACPKHFPGHGGTREDSHAALPRVAASRDQLVATELLPFAEVHREARAMMVAHVVYEGVDRDLPATLSPACATGLLREHLGFQGVAITDDLEMQAIRARWGVVPGALRAMSAGCDLLTVAHTVSVGGAVATALAQASERDPRFAARLDEAASRVTALRRSLVQALPPNPYRESLPRLLREVAQREAALGHRGPRASDPTTQRR